MRLLASLAGAVVAPALLVLGVALLYKPYGPDNWDLFTPLVTMSALLPAAVVGFVAGGAVADGALMGDAPAARRAAGSVLALVAIGAVVIARGPRIAVDIADRWTPRRGPPSRAERDRWVSERAPITNEFQGGNLAWTLEQCVRAGVPGSGQELITRCLPDLERQYDGVAEAAYGRVGRYSSNDDGWRWNIVGHGDVLHAIVYPDPLLGRDGPVFDVRPYRILRRERKDGHGFFADSTPARVATFHAAIAPWTREQRASGRWNGRGETLPPLFPPLPEVVSAGGPAFGAAVIDRPDDASGVWRLDVGGGGMTRTLTVEYRATAATNDTPFTLAFYGTTGVGYLIDDAGGWHARHGGAADHDDPAPPPCVLDPSVACD